MLFDTSETNGIIGGNTTLPEGLGMALAQNTYALEHFASLPEDEKRSVIVRAKNVNSQSEMRSLVEGLISH